MGRSQEKRLIWVIIITLVIFAGEVAGGVLSNSLALLSDAGHVLTDTFALGLSLIALCIQRRPSDYRATYGYQRIGILAALINGCSLVIIAIFIFIETYRRFIEPPLVNSDLMLVVAAVGLAGNIVMASILGSGHTDLNMKSAWLHVLGDTISSGGSSWLVSSSASPVGSSPIRSPAASSVSSSSSAAAGSSRRHSGYSSNSRPSASMRKRSPG